MNLKLFIEILAPAIMFYFFENFLRQKLKKKKLVAGHIFIKNNVWFAKSKNK
jgi:hypothetical protein